MWDLNVRVLVVAQLLRARHAEDLAIGDREPLPRKLTHTICHQKFFFCVVVVAASSPQALVASSISALGWVRADVLADSWPGLLAGFWLVSVTEDVDKAGGLLSPTVQLLSVPLLTAGDADAGSTSP